MYIYPRIEVNCTRFDIAYSVSEMSRFTSNPSMDH